LIPPALGSPLLIIIITRMKPSLIMIEHLMPHASGLSRTLQKPQRHLPEYTMEEALRKAILRSKKKERNANGTYNRHGGNNTILNEAQEEAIRQYCYEQWELGLGAIYDMVLSAITYLRSVYLLLIYLVILTNILLETVLSSAGSFKTMVYGLVA
jgi:hypothetical protein